MHAQRPLQTHARSAGNRNQYTAQEAPIARKALVVRHVAFEDLGGFAPVLAKQGFKVDCFDVGTADFNSTTSAASDLVVILGGPIGVYEEDKYPFLIDELRFIEARLAADKPMIGICLGAQLIAKALGAKVYPGQVKEIGFAPLIMTADGASSCVGVFAGHDVLHWHGDVLDLPAGAVRLASTEVCPNQAFSYGKNAIGFQFHPEFDGRGFERWLVGHTLELAQCRVDICALREKARSLAGGLEVRAASCLDQWLSQVMPGQSATLLKRPTVRD